MNVETEEARLKALSDEELRDEIDACAMECPTAELLFGEAERRNMDI